MLYNNHKCKLYSQYFSQLATTQFEAGCPTGDILLTTNDAFNVNQELLQVYATEAYLAMQSRSMCDESDWEGSYRQLALYGVFMSGTVMGYDCKSGKLAMYTSSIEVLKGLAQRGVLVGKKEPIAIELEAVHKKLYNIEKIRKSLRGGNNIVCVRLDGELKGSSLKMTCTVPRSALSLDTFVFVPFSAYSKVFELITNLLQSHILRVEMDEKVRDVTLNREILSSIYGVQRANGLCSYLPNAYMQRLYVPNIGASKYTPGVTNLRLQDVTSIRPISLADVDMSEVNLDYSMVKDYFKGVLSKLGNNNKFIVELTTGLDLSCQTADLDVIQEEIMATVSSMYDMEVWNLMKAYPEVFNPANYVKWVEKNNRYGTGFQPIDLPVQQKDLEVMLKEGVYRIVINKRGGMLSTMIVTNSPKHLKRVLGDDYFAKYESYGMRYREALRLKGRGCSSDECLYLTGVDPYTAGTYDADDNRTVIKQTHLLTVRNLEATSEKNFYKNVDVNSITDLVRLS